MQKEIFWFLWTMTWEEPEKQQILESFPLLTVINHQLCQCLLLGMIKDQDPTTLLCSMAVTAGGFHMWAASRSFYTLEIPFSQLHSWSGYCFWFAFIEELLLITINKLLIIILIVTNNNNNNADLKAHENTPTPTNCRQKWAVAFKTLNTSLSSDFKIKLSSTASTSWTNCDQWRGDSSEHTSKDL